MTFKVIINNYQLGTMVKLTPTHKIVRRDRLDKSHTQISYDNVTEREVQFIKKVFGKE